MHSKNLHLYLICPKKVCISTDLCRSRVMSQYPPTYREPLLPPEQTPESREQLAFSPVKAAPSDLTSSAFDHPAVK